jgi:hypothetical protein
MTLTADQATALRRHAGYGLLGNSLPSTYTGYRFFTEFGLLEFRLNNFSASELTVALRFQTQLDALELAIFGAGDNLDTAAASVWTHNKNELSDREALYLSFRKKLCDFLAIPLGPYAVGSGASSYSVPV